MHCCVASAYHPCKLSSNGACVFPVVESLSSFACMIRHHKQAWDILVCLAAENFEERNYKAGVRWLGFL